MESKSNPKISIVTIVRNDAEGFLITARSILRQDYSNIEWIVIDGLSTDGTDHYVKNLAPAISSYKIEKDTGIYNAMNKGIDMVSGEWVFFMNADDAFYEPSTISNYASKLLDDDDIVYSDVQRREDGLIHKYKNKDQFWAGMTLDHQSSCVRSEIYKRFKYDESLKIAGDLNFFSQARAAGYNFRKLDGIIACVKPFGTGLSSSYADRQVERVKVLRRYFDGPQLISTLHSEFRNALKSQVITIDTFNFLSQYIGME